MNEVSVLEHLKTILDEREKAHEAQRKAVEKTLDAAAEALSARLDMISKKLDAIERKTSDFGGRFWVLSIFMVCASSALTAGLVLLVTHLTK